MIMDADYYFDLLALRLRNKLVAAHRLDRQLSRQTSNQEPLLDWGRRYLPEHFSLPPSIMHQWLGKKLDAMSVQTGRRLNVLGPRGGAKSTLGTLVFPMRMALEGKAKYIWILSDTLRQAQTHLNNVKQELESNYRIRQDYPDAVKKGKRWTQSTLELGNGCVIEAFGTGQKLRGRRYGASRPNLIIGDDLQNDTHILNATARENSLAWFEGTVMKAGNSRTNFLCLSTALHPDAIALRLTRNPGWESRTFSSIMRWPQNMTLWEQWEELYLNMESPNRQQAADEFYRVHKEEMHQGAKVVWEENEDLLSLMKIRAEEGHIAFEREKQNSPMNPELCEWPESYFDDSVWYETAPTNYRIKVMTLDPSKGMDAHRGDYSAFVMLTVGSDGTLYVQADLKRRPVEAIIADGVGLYRAFRPNAFGIETNQFQQLLADGFTREFRTQGLVGQPIGIVNTLRKEARIRTLGALFSARRVRFKATPDVRLLVEQLKQFPLGDHDDGPDALEMAVRLAAECLNPNDCQDGLGDRLNISI